MAKPFRWNIHKREQLGTLANPGRGDAIQNIEAELRLATARILDACGDSDLVFVGRSPESIFDYMSGVLGDTSWSKRLRLFNISMPRGREGLRRIRREAPHAEFAVRPQYAQFALDPKSVIHHPRTIAMVDLVATGATFGRMVEFWEAWSEACGLDRQALQRKLRFVGLTRRTKTSPNTWRWHQHSDWAQAWSSSAIKNVSISWRFWHYLGNTQHKVSRSNPFDSWGATEHEKPPSPPPVNALQLALYLYDLGKCSDERKRLKSEMVKLGGMKQAWYRNLVQQIA